MGVLKLPVEVKQVAPEYHFGAPVDDDKGDEKVSSRNGLGRGLSGWKPRHTTPQRGPFAWIDTLVDELLAET